MEQLDILFHQAGPLGLVLLALAAALEYIFPPFPGDAITLIGGLYSYRGGSSLALVFGAVMIGTLLGASFDYALGRWIAQRLASASPNGWFVRHIKREQIDRWKERFRKRGFFWLLLNRFLPAIRGPIFFAAGIAQIPWSRVIFWGGLSALLWNSLLLACGYALGGQVDKLETLLLDYGLVSWTVLAIIGATLIGRAFWKKYRRQIKLKETE